jgi:peptide chain release factor 2
VKFWCGFDIAQKEQRVTALEQESTRTDFWGDQRAARAKMRRLLSLREQVKTWRDLERNSKEALDLLELAAAEDDGSLVPDLTSEAETLESNLEKHEFRLMLAGKHDQDDALLSIHAGAGGTESQDWVEMLLRMYLRWAESRGYEPAILDRTDGEEAGIKSVTVMLKGSYAYGFAKAERGVHRLVRISPFDASNRRHTSFAKVEVMPDLEDDIEIEINPEDIEMDVFKAGGAGGQHVQKNSTAIRLRHLPSGIVVSCQNERSQMQNRETAMKILRARLYDMEREKQEAEAAKLKGEHVDAGWGNQIRSYVLHPYKMVKDHRTNHEVGNADAVLDGRLDDFVEVWLRHQMGALKSG